MIAFNENHPFWLATLFMLGKMIHKMTGDGNESGHVFWFTLNQKI